MHFVVIATWMLDAVRKLIELKSTLISVDQGICTSIIYSLQLYTL